MASFFRKISNNSKINNLIAALLLISIVSCNQSPSRKKNSKEKNVSEAATGVKEIKTQFKEGAIVTKITTPGSALGELFQQIDPSKGNTSKQMKELSEKLSAKDKALLEEQSKKNGMLNLAVLMLPVRSILYIKGNEATAKFDAITFHGENHVDYDKKTGIMYSKSQNSANDITVRYTGDSFKQMNPHELNIKDYDVVRTTETENVAGYLCTKSVYTLKNAAKVQKSEVGVAGASGTVYKIDVWTSAEMPQSLNFLHPLYVEEKAGIMKLLIQYEKDLDFKVLYEFSSVESRPVTEAEMTIKQNKTVYDFGKDPMQVGVKMLGIIFGM